MDQAFTVLVDRAALEGIALLCWNPTMDLLALATADGQLHVHRLNWQRLWWTSSPEARITALDWRPDGKQLAAGLEDGSVMLLNTEDGEVQRREALLPDAVVALSWTEAAGEAAPLGEDRTRRLFPPRPAPVPPSGATLPEGYATLGQRAVAHWPPEPLRLELLACASYSGELLLCTSGLFQLARVSLGQLLGTPHLQCCQLMAAASLEAATVCWQATAEGRGGGGAGPRLHLATLDTRAVGRNSGRLHRLGLLAAEAAAALAGCHASCEAACREWEGAMQEWAAATQRLQADLDKFASSVPPQEQLLQLLATGALSPGMLQFLSVTLGEPGLKKLARMVDSAVRAVHSLLADRLQPALEELAFRLGELRGLALCRPWSTTLGLSAAAAGAAEQAALRLLVRAEALRRALVAVGAAYRAFCTWLFTLLRRLQEGSHDALAGYPRSQVAVITEFVRGQYVYDAIGLQLYGPGGGGAHGGAAPGSPATQPQRQQWQQKVDGGSDGLGLIHEVLEAGCSSSSRGAGAAGALADAQPSIRQQLAELETGISSALSGTCAGISPLLAVASGLGLGAIAADETGKQPSQSALGWVPAEAGGAAVGCACFAEQVLVVREAVPRQTGAATPAVAGGAEGALLQLPVGTHAVDVALYKEGQLVLLLAEEGGAALVMLQQDRLAFSPLPADAPDCRELLARVGAVTPLPESGIRRRRLPLVDVRPPLAVSASRGVGCVLAAPQRVLLLDLEEHEEGEEEEGQAGEEGGMEA
eukprot:scaffold18.g1987.t1